MIYLLSAVSSGRVGVRDAMNEYIEVQEDAKQVSDRYGTPWTLYLLCILIEISFILHNVFETDEGEMDPALVADLYRAAVVTIALFAIQIYTAVRFFLSIKE